MGIEQFFGGLSTVYRREKFLTPWPVKFPAEALFFDFNSIIHRVSQQLVDELNHAMRLFYAGRFDEAVKLTLPYINSVKSWKGKPPANADDISVLGSDGTHEAVIYRVSETVMEYIEHLPKCKYVYLAIDGVPGYGKMREQRHRRFMGEITAAKVAEIAQKHMLKFPKTAGTTDYPYDYRAYYASRLSFNKSVITPGTNFMRALEADLSDRFAHIVAERGIELELSGMSVPGEGEMKIVDLLRSRRGREFEHVVVYSPDADMILLTILTQAFTGKQITLLRYDQQKQENAIVNIATLRDILAGHLDAKKYPDAIEDIIFLFTVFGDDFLPRLEGLSARDHLRLITDIYKNTIAPQGSILHVDDVSALRPSPTFRPTIKDINVRLLRDFFAKLIAALSVQKTRKRHVGGRRFQQSRYSQMTATKGRFAFTPGLRGGSQATEGRSAFTPGHGGGSQATPGHGGGSQATPGHGGGAMSKGRRNTFIPDTSDGLLINALQKEIHQFVMLEGPYTAERRQLPPREFYKYYKMDVKTATTEYMRGLRWLYNYYFHGKLGIDWVYPYEKSPFINDIYSALQTVDTLPDIPVSPANVQMTTAEHLTYVSPSNVSGEMIKSTDLTNVQTFYNKIGTVNATTWISLVNVECINVPYRTKCRIEFDDNQSDCHGN